MAFTNDEILRKAKEKNCFSITAQRKYYHTGNCFVKRSLRRSEWQLTRRGTIHLPRQGADRIRNEAAALRFVADHTDIPVPRLHCCFEDDEAVYLVTEYVEGVILVDLEDDQKETVKRELRRHLETLHALRSDQVGGPEGGATIFPYRALKELLRDDWALPVADTDEYVFCHGDLSQNNVLVDPKTLKITAIIDWEHAGFFLEFFESPFFERSGPSVVTGDEENDTQRLVEFIKNKSSPFR